MTQYTSTDPKQIIKAFIQEAFSDMKSKNIKGFSRHIDEIFPKIPQDRKSQIKIALDLYRELIEQYDAYSADLMAVLVIGTDYEDNLQKHNLQELLDGKLELSPPPELYLAERAYVRDAPFVVEEYKVPVKEGVKPSNGVVYSYYKTIRHDSRDIYLTGFYFEHYPNIEAEVVEHDWE